MRGVYSVNSPNADRHFRNFAWKEMKARNVGCLCAYVLLSLPRWNTHSNSNSKKKSTEIEQPNIACALGKV